LRRAHVRAFLDADSSTFPHPSGATDIRGVPADDDRASTKAHRDPRQRTFDASSASAERSPFDSVTWPATLSPLNFSTTVVRPFDVASTYGLSIWYGSPLSTTLVASPTRVMIVFTSWGVRFCASSTMMNWFGIDRPRMYVRGSISMKPMSISSWWLRPFCRSVFDRPIRNSTLS